MFVDHAPPAIFSAALGGEVLEVEFRAGDETHVSKYTTGWLRAHDSQDLARTHRDMSRTWDANIASTLPEFGYEDYMRSNSALRAWIETMKTTGIALLRGVPQASGKLLEVAHRIGPVRTSNFGQYYDVISMPNPNASAYTQIGLELHTDLANWREPPDVQLLCCLKNSVIGGESVFADGFRVAEEFRIAHAEAFGLLSTHQIEYRFHDHSCDIRTMAPVIELDRAGRLKRIRFNNWLRAALVAPDELIDPMYKALGTFWRMLRDPQYRLCLRLESGHLIAYDNNRVLHGRASFDGTSGERHLQGCYLNQEDIDSRLRLLDRAEN